MTNRPIPTRRFETVYMYCLLIFLIGIYVDGWAHNHIVDSFESFFTTYHFILYSGFGASFLWVLYAVRKNMNIGFLFRDAIPKGYGSAVVGGFIFSLAGIFDGFWHTAFGFEKSISALHSPPHLLLFLGAGLMFISPIRYALFHVNVYKLRPSFLLVNATAFFLLVVSFHIQYAIAFARIYAAPAEITSPVFLGHALGAISLIFSTIVIIGILLYVMRSFTFPFGSFTYIFGIYVLFISIIKDTYFMIPVVLAGGMIADVIYMKLKRFSSTLQLRVFSCSVPGFLFAMYFLVIILTTGIWWPVHLWSGLVFVSMLVGLLMSYLVIPAKVSDDFDL